MRTSQIENLRRAKLQRYVAYLPDMASWIRSVPSVNDDAYHDILLEIATAGASGLGLKVGLQSKLTDLGVLGQATLGCSDLREVFSLWEHFSSGAGEMVNFGSEVDGDGNIWTLSVSPYPSLSLPVAELVIDELCAAFFGFARQITGRHFLDFTVSLPHERRAGVDYAIAFPGRVIFNAPVCCLTGPASVLDLPVVPRQSGEASAILRTLGWSHEALERRTDTVIHIQDFLVKSTAATMTLSCAAAAVGLSERTLVRRLANEGTGFGRVLDEFRSAYCLALIRHGGFQPKEIAHIVGFNSENGLRKAFKKWHGRPIGEWSRLDAQNQVSA